VNEFVDEVFSAELGKTWLFSVGQAGFIIKSTRGKLLGIDLYLSDCVEPLEGHIGFKRLLPKILSPRELVFDVIVATHEHYDHFDVDSMPALMANDKTRLFASLECATLVGHGGIDKSRVTYVRPGDAYVVGDFSIRFTSCDHGRGAPDAVGVLVEVDGKRIFEAGDTCLRLDRVDEYLASGPLDVLIAPINGKYGNLNERECAELANALKPSVTIPCHYGMFASHGGNPGAFHDIMRTEFVNNRYLLMTQGEMHEL
jgi:L-ascorbate 6-phosphate lactonase